MENCRMCFVDILDFVVKLLVLVDITTTDILNVTKNLNITIKCPLKSSKVVVQWKGPPDRTIYSSNNWLNPEVKGIGITGEHEQGEFNLVVYGFNETNEGIYQCSTVIGNQPVEENFNIRLRIRKLILPITINPSQSVKEGSNISITCNSSSNPPPVVFRMLGPEGYVLQTKNLTNNTKSQVFTLINVKLNATGNYTCNAENAVTSENVTAWFYVFYCPEVPILKSVLPGTNSVIINWSGGFNGCFPQSFVVEYKQAHTVKWLDHKLKITELNRNSYRYVINNLLPHVHYDVRMYAVNSMNRSQYSHAFKVTTDGEAARSKLSDIPVYITIGIVMFLVTLVAVGFFMYKSGILKRRLKHRENRNRTEGEGSSAYNNINDINENRQPTVRGAAAASVLFSNFRSNEVLRSNRSACEPMASKEPQDKKLVKQDLSELNYIEIELNQIPEEHRFHIHGHNNRSEYSDIEFGVIGDPLPSSDSEMYDDNDKDTSDCMIGKA